VSVTAAGSVSRGGAQSLPLVARVLPHALVVGLAAAAFVVYSALLRNVEPPDSAFSIPWWSLILLFFVTEAFPVHVQFRSEAHSVSLGELALIVGLYLLAADELIVAQLLGAAVALVIVRQQRSLTAAFNLAVLTLSTCLALACFHGFLLLGDANGPAGWIGAALGAGAYTALALLLVMLRARLVSRRPLTTQPRTLAAVAAGGSFASASLAVCAMQLAQHDLRSLWVMIVPIASTAVALTTYTSLRRRQGHLEFLSRSMRALQGVEFRSSVRDLLEAARTMLSAEVAEIIVVPHLAGQGALRSAVSPLEQALMDPISFDDASRRALGIVSQDEAATLLPEVRPAHALDEYLAERGLRDAIVTALRGGDRILGLVLVGNRMGDAASFTQDDRRLFETFASHAAALLENDRVKRQLRHQAFHDSLTGFANRVLFAERVRRALDASATDARRPAVLFLDLDDFKKVNDSLGHSAGDQLLLAAADRVRSCLRPDDVVARLGGDEFAVLLERASRDDSELIAKRLVEALQAPFVLEGTEMKVHASIGIALANAHTAADDMLRNADVAMYSAKTNGKGSYAWYDPEMHVQAQRRQELQTTLEGSVERDEIEAYYQPIVALDTGRVVGLEALARWRHPDRGLVLPDSFIPLAEEGGLMPPIGRAVLRLACEQLSTWRSRHRFHDELMVSVNLSQSELRNANLTREVETILAETGIPPDRLVLEITESSAMQDRGAVIEMLTKLRRLDVRLALDDFGTGYSSLSHLRDFPIDMLKIAKPFIDRIEDESTFVDAILRLAETLGLEVVAEGIETSRQAEMLRSLGCSLGQGFYFAKPAQALDVGSRLAFGPVVLRPDRDQRVA
jgi:diguanylate cyclase (GGDEF)-like protein